MRKEVPDWEELGSEIDHERRVPRNAQLRQTRSASLLTSSSFWSGLCQDALFAVRSYRRTPLLTLTALVTLMLGIRATTGIFSLLYAVLLKPLPYPESDRLVMIHALQEGEDRGRNSVSYPDFEDWKKSPTETFEDLALGTY